MAVKVPAPNEPQTCETCKFWLETKPEEVGEKVEKIGQCRRYPPTWFWKQTEGGPLVSSPVTLSTWSCGEYKGRSGRPS